MRISACLSAMPGGELDNIFSPSRMMEAPDLLGTLSRICRWNGRCSRFYSVLDHSLNLARIVSPECRLHALIHDFSEAWIGDIPRPFKSMPEMAWLREAEKRLDQRVWKHYAGVSGMPTEVMRLDQALAMREADVLGLGGQWNHMGNLPRVECDLAMDSEPGDFLAFMLENGIEAGGELGKMLAREEAECLSRSRSGSPGLP